MGVKQIRRDSFHLIALVLWRYWACCNCYYIVCLYYIWFDKTLFAYIILYLFTCEEEKLIVLLLVGITCLSQGSWRAHIPEDVYGGYETISNTTFGTCPHFVVSIYIIIVTGSKTIAAAFPAFKFNSNKHRKASKSNYRYTEQLFRTNLHSTRKW